MLEGGAPAADVEVHVRRDGAGLLVSVQATGGGTRQLVLSVPGRRLSPVYPAPGPETAGSLSFTLGPELPEIVTAR